MLVLPLSRSSHKLLHPRRRRLPSILISLLTVSSALKPKEIREKSCKIADNGKTKYQAFCSGRKAEIRIGSESISR